MSLSRRFLVLVAAGMLAQLVFSHSLGLAAAPRDVELLRKMPVEQLSRLAFIGRPDDKGLVARNRDGWLHARMQASGAFYLAAAAALANPKAADDAWRTVDAAFEHQTAQGNFQIGAFLGNMPTASDDLMGVSFYLADLCHALLVVQDSVIEGNRVIADSFRERIEKLTPKVRLAARWLSKGKDTLEEFNADAPDRLFVDAQAFALAGLFLHDDELKRLGKHFLDLGLKHVRNDGVITEKGGHDSSYQASSLLRMQVYCVYVPDEALSAAIDRAAAWELSRIKANGEVDVTGNTRTGLGQERFLGRDKNVNYPDVVLALFYYGVRTGNKEYISAAQRAFAVGFPPAQKK
jgi:hypothetical protein